MFTCKQIAKMLSEKKLSEMTPLKRWWILLHVKLCSVCGEYQRDAIKFQDSEIGYRENENFDKKLDSDAKKRLKEKLHAPQVEEVTES